MIEVCDIPGRPDCLFVDVCDDPQKRYDTCAVVVAKTPASERIEVGDQVWWQSGSVYWTPKHAAVLVGVADTARTRDIAIPKIGYSGVKHPSRMPANN